MDYPQVIKFNRELQFLDENTGFLVGDYPADYYYTAGKMEALFAWTTDGAETWNIHDLDLKNILLDIDFYDNNSRAILTGDWGLMLELVLEY